MAEATGIEESAAERDGRGWGNGQRQGGSRYRGGNNSEKTGGRSYSRRDGWDGGGKPRRGVEQEGDNGNYVRDGSRYQGGQRRGGARGGGAGRFEVGGSGGDDFRRSGSRGGSRGTYRGGSRTDRWRSDRVSANLTESAGGQRDPSQAEAGDQRHAGWEIPEPTPPKEDTLFGQEWKPEEKKPFVCPEPKTNFHLEIMEENRKMREERSYICDENGVPLFDCQGLHGLDTFCQFCDGRRGAWATGEVGEPSEAFRRYQDSIINSRMNWTRRNRYEETENVLVIAAKEREEREDDEDYFEDFGFEKLTILD